MPAWIAAFNRHPIWHRTLRVQGARLRACSFDRLLYLVLHRLGAMGKEERVFFNAQVQPGTTVVEAGANIGIYTLQLSRLVGPEGRVIAFEPDPHLFACLSGNIRRAEVRNVELHPCALGSAPGTISLAWDGVNSGDTHLTRQVKTGATQVQLARLDDVLAGRRIDFFKLDVQGWELEVLLGATALLAANPQLRLFVEYWPEGLRRAGTSPADLVAFFHAHGWQLASPRDLQPIDAAQFAAWDANPRAFHNLLLTRPAIAETGSDPVA